MSVEKLELEALAHAAWPSNSPEDRCALAMVKILINNEFGPAGPYSMRASSVGIEISKTDPEAWNNLPTKALKRVVAHAYPHVVLVDDPTCTNPVNAGLQLLEGSLRNQTRPQLHRLDYAGGSLHEGTAFDGDSSQQLPAPCTPELLAPGSSGRMGMGDGMTGVDSRLCQPSTVSMDRRLLALATYPVQHRPAQYCSFEENITHLRCATAVFLLSHECAKGPLGPCCSTGARVSNVLRTSLGQKWGAVVGRGPKLNLIADKVLLLKPHPFQADAMIMQLDLHKLQERAMQAIAKALPSPLDSIQPATSSGGLSKPPKPGAPAAAATQVALMAAHDPSALPWHAEVETALAALTHAAFPGSAPLSKLRRKAAVLLLQYCLAVHHEQPGPGSSSWPALQAAAGADEGWQLCTAKRKPAHRQQGVHLADLVSASSGFGAMPCSSLGSTLHKLMPKDYVQVPATSNGKHLKSIYWDVACFVKYQGPRQSETYLKLDVQALAGIGACSPEQLQHAMNAIAGIPVGGGVVNTGSRETARALGVHGSQHWTPDLPTSDTPTMQQQQQQQQQQQLVLQEAAIPSSPPPLPYEWQDLGGLPLSQPMPHTAHPSEFASQPMPLTTGASQLADLVVPPPGFGATPLYVLQPAPFGVPTGHNIMRGPAVLSPMPDLGTLPQVPPLFELAQDGTPQTAEDENHLLSLLINE